MIVFYAPNHRQHAPKFQYFNKSFVGYPDVPGRVDTLLAACQQLKLPIHISTTPASVESLAAVHSRPYIEHLKAICTEIPLREEIFDFRYAHDTFTPLVHHTYVVARQSANLALLAATAVLSTDSMIAYALCRPPGHHAGRDTMAGFCYFNNAALAAERLAKHGKVAILDIDYHHGNGTQEIFYNRSDVLYVSLHADPSYDFPHTSGRASERGAGQGLGFTHNYPLPKTTSPGHYLRTLRAAITNITSYMPSFIVVSLGFDTYKYDPIAGFNLDKQSFHTIGSLIASELQYPTVIVQEGGYNTEKLGELARQFFTRYLAGAP